MSVVGHWWNTGKCHDRWSYFCIFISDVCAIMGFFFLLKVKPAGLRTCFPHTRKIIYKSRNQARPLQKASNMSWDAFFSPCNINEKRKRLVTWRCFPYGSSLLSCFSTWWGDGEFTNNSEQHPKSPLCLLTHWMQTREATHFVSMDANPDSMKKQQLWILIRFYLTRKLRNDEKCLFKVWTMWPLKPLILLGLAHPLFCNEAKRKMPQQRAVTIDDPLKGSTFHQF